MLNLATTESQMGNREDTSLHDNTELNTNALDPIIAKKKRITVEQNEVKRLIMERRHQTQNLSSLS